MWIMKSRSEKINLIKFIKKKSEYEVKHVLVILYVQGVTNSQGGVRTYERMQKFVHPRVQTGN